MSILIFDDYTFMYDNEVTIQTVFVRFGLPKVDTTTALYQVDLSRNLVVTTANLYLVTYF